MDLYAEASAPGLLIRGDTPPAAVIRLARRARMYYGLQAEAARVLGVGRRYVSGVLNLQRFNPSGRLGHWRVFECVAGLVRDCEAGAAAVNQHFVMRRDSETGNGGRFMRATETPLLCDALLRTTEAAALVSRGKSGGVKYWAWGDTLRLVRLLRPMRERINLASPPLIVRMHDLGADCPACAGHLLIIWLEGRPRPVLIWDTDAGLELAEALRDMVSDAELLAYTIGDAAPVESFSFSLPCAA